MKANSALSNPRMSRSFSPMTASSISPCSAFQKQRVLLHSFERQVSRYQVFQNLCLTEFANSLGKLIFVVVTERKLPLHFGKFSQTGGVQSSIFRLPLARYTIDRH